MCSDDTLKPSMNINPTKLKELIGFTPTKQQAYLLSHLTGYHEIKIILVGL